MAKKKTNGLSVAIVALNIVIVGIIILLVVLVYLHMKEDIDNGRTEGTTTTPAASGSESEEADVSSSDTSNVSDTSDSDESAEDESALPVVSLTSYDRSFFVNDLFIGDSIFTGLYIYDFLDKNNVFAEAGMNPETALTHQIDGATCAEKASSMQPQNIYIMLGTNSISDIDFSYMANKMVELIAVLETACPTAGIYIITIPPVTAAHEAEGRETMELVNGYNSRLREICAEGGYSCIGLDSVLKDENGYLSSKYAEADGLHFLYDAYTATLSYIEQSVWDKTEERNT